MSVQQIDLALTAGAGVHWASMEAKQTQRQLRMEDEQWDRAKRVAEDLDRSVSWVIRKALEEYIDRHLAEKRAARSAQGKPAQ